MNQKAKNGKSNDKTVAAVLAEMRSEIKESVRTRLLLFKSELREKLEILKIAAPLATGGILLLGTAYLLFTMALVGLAVAFFQDNPYRWCIAFLAVAVLWSLLGGVALYLAKHEFEWKELFPKRTIEVLKADRVWFESEVKNQYEHQPSRESRAARFRTAH